MKYEWDSYCNIICNIDNTDYCSIYNNTYVITNGTEFNKLLFVCDIINKYYRKDDIEKLYTFYRNSNKTIDEYYSTRMEIISNYYTANKFNSSLNNTLNDGKYISYSITRFVNYTNDECGVFECNDDVI